MSLITISNNVFATQSDIRFTNRPMGGNQISEPFKPNQIFYVFKVLDDAVLLGLTPYISLDSTQNRFAWVPRSLVHFWRIPIALEPNPNLNAMKEKIKNWQPAKIFRDKLSAKLYKNGKFRDSTPSKIIWEQSSLEDSIQSSNIPQRFIVTAVDTLDSDIISVVLPNESSTDFVQGFTTLKVKNHRYLMFKRVLLLSKEELSYLIHTLDKFIKSKDLDTSTLRERFHEFYIDLLTVYIDLISAEKTSTGIPLSKLEEYRSKLNYIPSIITEIKPTELSDQVLLTNEELRNYLIRIEFINKTLGEIFRAVNPRGSFVSNNIQYYWIEESLIP